MQPHNRWLGIAKSGDSFVNYYCLGGMVDFDGLKAAFTVREYTDVLIFYNELERLLCDAHGALKGTGCSPVSFFDFSSGSLVKLLGFMECEFHCLDRGTVTQLCAQRTFSTADAQEHTTSGAALFPTAIGKLTFLVNFQVRFERSES